MPASTQRVTKLRRAARSVGLLRIAFVAWRHVRFWKPRILVNNRRLRNVGRGNTPIPPGSLIFSATGSRDVQWFLDSGSQTAGAFRSALDSIGRPLESFEDVFELGCGCGRVLRQWADVKGPRFHASDYNPKGVEWGKRFLKHVSFSTNDLQPPLPFANESFDLCYAVSVFTHLPEELQMPWLQELHRVLKPGGMLMVTLSGEGDLIRTTAEEQARFRNGELVVIDPKFAGTNICGVYHPESYVRRNWSSLFSILKFLPQGAAGSPKQDLYVLEKHAGA
jgi:SAM-dependent methyltransferase